MSAAVLWALLVLAVGGVAAALAWRSGRRRARRRAARVLAEDLLKILARLEPGRAAIEESALAREAQLPLPLVRWGLLEARRLGWVQVDEGIAALRPGGRRRAIELIRAHRLLEHRLAARDRLDLEAIHPRAHHDEHALTPEATARLEAELGYPLRDPHGDLIPAAGGELPPVEGTPLGRWPPDRPGRIQHMEDEPPALFRQLLAMGLGPGRRVVVRRHDPGRSLVEVDGEGLQALAPEALGMLTVVPVAEEEVALAALRPGERGRIVRLAGSGAQQRRILELGLVPGTVVSVVRSAPLGDPVEYRVRRSTVALRREEAARVLVARERQDGP